MSVWRRSSFCATKACIEVQRIRDGVWVKFPGDEPLRWATREEWDAFIAGVKAGEFDE